MRAVLLLRFAIVAAIVLVGGCGTMRATSDQHGVTFAADGVNARRLVPLVESSAYEQTARADEHTALANARVATTIVENEERVTLVEMSRICNDLLEGSVPLSSFQRCACDAARREVHARQMIRAVPGDIYPGQYEAVRQVAEISAARGAVWSSDGYVAFPTCSRDPTTARLTRVEAKTAKNSANLIAMKNALNTVLRGTTKGAQ